jgi:Mg2+/Co2+ transporter CorC
MESKNFALTEMAIKDMELLRIRARVLGVIWQTNDIDAVINSIIQACHSRKPK